jgi:uncharacterized Ntn-hydrolase superfamily protein
MTFSISGRCARTGMFGIAVSSSSPCVAARCAHARAGIGVCATQNITDPTIGPRSLGLLASGLSAAKALESVKAAAEHIEFRQIAILDREGRTAGFSGARTLGLHRIAEAENAIAAGNLLASPEVPLRMIEAFGSNAALHLGERLLLSMRAALAAGGEEGPVHSVGMIVVDKVAWPVADLRIDWHETDPIGELGRLWDVWQPQMDAYVTRALDPRSAPSYGVAGDL